MSLCIYISCIAHAEQLSIIDLKKLSISKNCMSCHKEEKKFIGPSYKNIAERYQNKKINTKTTSETVEILSIKIRHGSTGNWGVIPMPANPIVSENEAKQLAKWILSM